MSLLNLCNFPIKLNTVGNKGFKLLSLIAYVTQNDLTTCQNSSDATGISNSLLNMSDIFTERVAVVNSSHGMETYFTSATLDFPKMRQQ